MDALLERSALLSRCGKYRWRLERKTGDEGIVAVILGVNPSTADAEIDDQTIRKDMGFAARLGWRRIIKGNLFAYRATDIKELRGLSYETAVGHENDMHLIEMFKEADVVVAAWGPTAKLPPRLRNRWRRVVSIAEHYKVDLMCFGTAQDGQPRHTLMLAYDTPLVPWCAFATPTLSASAPAAENNERGSNEP